MPNTLIHLAAQSAASAPVFRARSTERRWSWDWPLIFLGAVLPDLPWILQRVLRLVLLRLDVAATPSGDPVFYDLRLHAGIQGSLAFCLLLAGACALPTRRPGRALAILSFGSMVHLLLDATQIKWANGVLLWAPFDWRLVRFDWLWPEHPAIPWLSLLGLVVCSVVLWRRSPPDTPLLTLPALHRTRWAGATLCLAAYVLLPFLWVGDLEASGAYSVQALRSPRPGTAVELGNAWVFASDEGDSPRTLRVRTMSEQQVAIARDSAMPLTPGRWSIRGRWVTVDGAPAIQVSEAHPHQRRVRESFSIAGLLLVVWIWLRSIRRLL